MKRLLLLALLLAAFAAPVQAAPPKIVVNIVVSQMRYDYLVRFTQNMPEGGFRRFMNEGAVFLDARYNFMQTITPATLATLTTGADPSMHGVVATKWIDYTTNKAVGLIDDQSAIGLNCDDGNGKYSNVNITTPTLGDRLAEEKRDSRLVTVAIDPISAVVMGGQHSDVYWMDETRGTWVSSTAYMDKLPEWVAKYNDMRIAQQYLDFEWTPSVPVSKYVNTGYLAIEECKSEKRMRRLADMGYSKPEGMTLDYKWVLYTPAGNSLVTEFAKQAITGMEMGTDDNVDLINICYDSPRLTSGYFGPESVEVEDMFYRLDREIAGLLEFVEGIAGKGNAIFVLTSDHGTSDSFDYGRVPRDRFNASQFKVIVNGFMNAQYGAGDWVVDYCDRQLYLNRNQIYMANLSLEEVQNRVAAFVLQFRGVSHVLTSTAMQNSFFSGSYAEKMQNSFYPRRSGDLTVNLMPGWIEEAEGKRAGSGSMYEYDTHVPLAIIGTQVYGQRIARTINMRDLAPTLAKIMGISRPIASEGEEINEITKFYE